MTVCNICGKEVSPERQPPTRAGLSAAVSTATLEGEVANYGESTNDLRLKGHIRRTTGGNQNSMKAKARYVYMIHCRTRREEDGGSSDGPSLGITSSRRKGLKHYRCCRDYRLTGTYGQNCDGKLLWEVGIEKVPKDFPERSLHRCLIEFDRGGKKWTEELNLIKQRLF